MVSQLVSYSAHVLPFAALWLAAVQDWIPTSKLTSESGQHVILYAPVYCVFFLGVYALCSVLHGVATFNDCESARAELVSEIVEARADLQKRRII